MNISELCIRRPIMTLLLTISVSLCSTLAAGEQAPAVPLSFERDVRPIFKANCFQCHGEAAETKGNLDLRLLAQLLGPAPDGPS